MIRLQRQRPVVGFDVADAIDLVKQRTSEIEAGLKKTGGLLGPGSDSFGVPAASAYLIGIPFREWTDEVPVVTKAVLGAVPEDSKGREDPWGTGHIAPKCMESLNDWIDVNGVERQSDTIRKVAQLVYAGAKPPMTAAAGEARVQAGREASALERAYYPVSSEWCVSREVADAFWKINEGFREVEAWAYNQAGSGQWMPELQDYFNHWRTFSHAWKTGYKRPTDLHGVTIDRDRVYNIAFEYGFPGAWHADKREQDYTKETFASKSHVVAPSAENQNDPLKGAEATRKALDAATDPKTIWDLFGLLPWWGKAALGVAAASVVGPPLVSASMGLSRALSKKSSSAGGRS